MNESVVRRTNLVGAWCGIAYIVSLFVGWWFVGGFFPLHRPSASAEEIAGFFHHDVVSIRLGMVIVMWGAATFIPFTSTIADYVARFEGRNGPLTRTMTMAGYSNAMLTSIRRCGGSRLRGAPTSARQIPPGCSTISPGFSSSAVWR